MTHAEKMKAAEEFGLKLRTFIGAIATPPKPELPEKIGYKWELAYTFGHDSFAWVSVPDPDAKGTRENPFDWEPGMATMVNGWYQHEGHLYVCVKKGHPDKITDTDYFEPMS